MRDGCTDNGAATTGDKVLSPFNVVSSALPNSYTHYHSLKNSLAMLVAILTFKFVQLASRISASCEAGVRFVELPNGDIIEDTARFNLDGVLLLKEKARPTFIFVLVANLNAFERVPLFRSLVSMSSC